MVVLLSVLTVVVISLIVYAFVLKPAENTATPSAGSPDLHHARPGRARHHPARRSPSPPSPAPPRASASSTRRSGRWSRCEEGELDLDAGGSDAVSVRLLQQTEVPTTSENVANIKAFTDGLVGSNKSAKILKVQGITVDGMPGYYYLYTFIDGETGAEGAHAQYFLFRGRNMYTIVFQALPVRGLHPPEQGVRPDGGELRNRPRHQRRTRTTTSPTTVG